MTDTHMHQTELKIYTKTGDKGQTKLLSGETVEKDDARVMAYGTLDELQAHLGMVRALVKEERIRKIVNAVQTDIFTAASELASTSENLATLKCRIGPDNVERIEGEIDRLSSIFGLPGHFLVPGKSIESSAVHVARTVCRRCERWIHKLNRQTDHYSMLIMYFNRLSDLLFVIAWSLEIRSIIEKVLVEILSAKGKVGDLV